jgi:hypothetical protein
MIPLGDPKQEVEYILEAERDRPPGEQTVFLLRGLDVRQRGYLRSQFSTDQGLLHFWMAKCAIAGWRNVDGLTFKSETSAIGGKEYEMVADECLDRIPERVLIEIGNVTIRRIGLAEDEKKN